MFLYLSKVLPLLVYPLGLASLLLLGVAVWGENGRFSRRLLILAFLLLWLGGNRWVAHALTAPLENRYPPLPPDTRADVIVVLGGATELLLPPRPIVELNGSGDRLLYAAWLYKQGVADHLLMTGGLLPRLSPDIAPSEAEAMRQVLEIMGVPAEAVWIEPDSRNTYENGVLSKAILDEKGINKIVLVTSAYHMPRSVAIFEKLGFTVLPAPTDYQTTELDRSYFQAPDLLTFTLYLLPDSDNLWLTSRVLKEYLGVVIYWLRGWL